MSFLLHCFDLLMILHQVPIHVLMHYPRFPFPTHSRSVLRWHFLCLIIAAALGQYLLQSLHMSLVSFPCISRMSWKELRARSWILQFKISCFTTFIYNNSQNMRLTLVFMWNSAQREKLISIFQEFSSSINKTIILARGLGTRLSFYEV